MAVDALNWLSMQVRLLLKRIDVLEQELLHVRLHSVSAASGHANNSTVPSDTNENAVGKIEVCEGAGVVPQRRLRLKKIALCDADADTLLPIGNIDNVELKNEDCEGAFDKVGPHEVVPNSADFDAVRAQIIGEEVDVPSDGSLEFTDSAFEPFAAACLVRFNEFVPRDQSKFLEVGLRKVQVFAMTMESVFLDQTLALDDEKLYEAVCDTLDVTADRPCNRQALVIWDFISELHILGVFVDTSGSVSPGDTNGQHDDHALPSECDLAGLQQGVQGVPSAAMPKKKPGKNRRSHVDKGLANGRKAMPRMTRFFLG